MSNLSEHVQAIVERIDAGTAGGVEQLRDGLAGLEAHIVAIAVALEPTTSGTTANQAITEDA